MTEIFNLNDIASLLAKQNEAIHICYDRLLDVLRETTNETVLIKCIEIIRKDMAALMAPTTTTTKPTTTEAPTTTTTVPVSDN